MATVEYEWDWEVTAYGETRQGHKHETYNLVIIDGKWYMEECIY